MITADAGRGQSIIVQAVPFRLTRWIAIVGIGEAMGFVFPALAGVLLVDSEWGYAALLLAGLIEGVLLGTAQFFAMRPHLDRLRPLALCALTAGAAVVAYALGLAPSTFSSIWMSWPLAIQVAAAVLLAAAILGSVGFAQWIELRHHLSRAGWWILGTAVAWLAGLGVFFAIAPPLWHDGQAIALATAVGVAAGAAMAFTMALVTGVTFAKLLSASHSQIAAAGSARP